IKNHYLNADGLFSTASGMPLIVHGIETSLGEPVYRRWDYRLTTDSHGALPPAGTVFIETSSRATLDEYGLYQE
ncbi:hypothetical protein, partial [Burkholderia ambifaria]|uniref:hypothetical protein n=1 Tax=Burkholderia ambifaria TaxID=152480 RepID=UPI001E5FF289